MSRGPAFVSGFVLVEGQVPPGYDGIVACYPQQLFRPERVETNPCEVSILIGGRSYPCSGESYIIEYGSTLAVGDFVAFHVRSASKELQQLRLKVWGRTVDNVYGTREPGIGVGFVGGIVFKPATFQPQESP
jgi:hypothetical protein